MPGARRGRGTAGCGSGAGGGRSGGRGTGDQTVGADAAGSGAGRSGGRGTGDQTVGADAAGSGRPGDPEDAEPATRPSGPTPPDPEPRPEDPPGPGQPQAQEDRLRAGGRCRLSRMRVSPGIPGFSGFPCSWALRRAAASSRWSSSAIAVSTRCRRSSGMIGRSAGTGVPGETVAPGTRRGSGGAPLSSAMRPPPGARAPERMHAWTAEHTLRRSIQPKSQFVMGKLLKVPDRPGRCSE